MIVCLHKHTEATKEFVNSSETIHPGNGAVKRSIASEDYNQQRRTWVVRVKQQNSPSHNLLDYFLFNVLRRDASTFASSLPARWRGCYRER